MSFDEEFKEINQKIKQLEAGSAVLSANLSDLELKPQLFENTFYDGKLWKVDRVAYGKVSALHSDRNSAPCFQKRGGYKFCSRLSVNGLFKCVTFRLINPYNTEDSVCAILSANISKLELKLQLFENTYYDGQQLLKVDRVTYGKVSALHSDSDGVPCFQKRGGYKFCFRLYLNGVFRHVTFRLINPYNTEDSVCESFIPDKNTTQQQQPPPTPPPPPPTTTTTFTVDTLERLPCAKARYVHEFKCEAVTSSKCETFILNHVPTNPSISIPVELLKNPTGLTWLLGKGSFADVYGYKYKDINCTVAIKKIIISTNGVTQEVGDVRKEVEMHMKLEHKNIVQYVGSCEVNNNLFIILEYMNNGSLRGRLNQLKQSQGIVANQPALSYDEIMKYAHEILAGLVYLHSNRIIHRDLRSANVLLSATNTAKLADFGISKELERLSIHSGFSTIVGNIYWHSPELIKHEKEKLGRRVDVWSLGITILEMIHVKPPFMERYQLASYIYALGVRKEIPEIPDFVRDDVKDILQKCLVFDVEERPHSNELLNYIS